jgi:hypothetical protein
MLVLFHSLDVLQVVLGPRNLPEKKFRSGEEFFGRALHFCLQMMRLMITHGVSLGNHLRLLRLSKGLPLASGGEVGLQEVRPWVRVSVSSLV